MPQFLIVLLVFPLLTWGNAGFAHSAAIASSSQLATQAGKTILAQGGNAFDAAVAVSAVLAVVEPYASGLGGGGFWLLHRASDSRDVMIDGREMAPGKATDHMYLDAENKLIRGASLEGPLAAAIPGTPAALVHIAKNYGQLPLTQSLAPAIVLARDGFKINQRFARTIKSHQTKLNVDTNARQIFLNGGSAPALGTVLRQPQLAETLTEISRKGVDGFYRGRVAQELIRSVRQAGGIWVHKDLLDYRVVERTPVKFTYRGTQVTTASLPSAGGLTLAQGLNILENFALSDLNEWDQVHLIAEALRHAYQDRVKYMGDSDFVRVPEAQLLSKEYARKRAALIDLTQATSDGQINKTESPGGVDTTHFSVIDEEGNRVAATMSINTFFGSGFVAGSTGVILNNEMDDFSIGQNIPNFFGLYGTAANKITPGKRPLSSMSPTFLEDEKRVVILGTPGGSRIISMILLAIVNYVDNCQVDALSLVSAPRFHHQYLPDQIEIEPDSFNKLWLSKLSSKGHTIKTAERRWGNMQLIIFDKKTRQSSIANDSRGSADIRY